MRQRAGEIGHGGLLRVGATLRVAFGNPRLVELHRIGERSGPEVVVAEAGKHFLDGRPVT